MPCVRDENGEVHAIHDICSHADVALSEGEVDGCTIECWLHGSRFDLRTGEPTGPPAVSAVPVYRSASRARATTPSSSSTRCPPPLTRTTGTRRTHD